MALQADLPVYSKFPWQTQNLLVTGQEKLWQIAFFLSNRKQRSYSLLKKLLPIDHFYIKNFTSFHVIKIGKLNKTRL